MMGCWCDDNGKWDKSVCGALLRWHACTCVIFLLRLFQLRTYILYYCAPAENFLAASYIVAWAHKFLFECFIYAHALSESPLAHAECVCARERRSFYVYVCVCVSLEQLWRIVYQQCAVSFWGSVQNARRAEDTHLRLSKWSDCFAESNDMRDVHLDNAMCLCQNSSMDFCWAQEIFWIQMGIIYILRKYIRPWESNFFQ